MSRISRLFLLVTVLLMSSSAGVVFAQTPVSNSPDDAMCAAALGVYGSTPDGSNFCMWLPAPDFVGDLVIFAHGYVDARVQDGAIPWDQLAIGGSSLPAMVVSQLHAAFAVTSYKHNGLAVTEGVEAVEALATMFKPRFNHIYLVGASEGGLVTALAIEQNPGRLFSGGVTTCGPVGDFRQQVNYWGNFRVTFDYFFRQLGQTLGNPVNVPAATISQWGAFDPLQVPPTNPLQLSVLAALAADPSATRQLLSVSRAPIDPNNPATAGATVLSILDYNVRATNQAITELGGQPFDNRFQFYFGSANDLRLNLWIHTNEQFKANPAALAAIQASYQTTGKITVPLVAMHTTGDPVVPYWHELFYLLKVWQARKSANFFTIPIQRYGHCAFTPAEAIFAYAVMVWKATGSLPILPLTTTATADNPLTQQEFANMLHQYNLSSGSAIFIPMINK